MGRGEVGGGFDVEGGCDREVRSRNVHLVWQLHDLGEHPRPLSC